MKIKKVINIVFALLLFVAFTSATPESNYDDQNTIVASHIVGTATFNKTSTNGKLAGNNLHFASNLISNATETLIKLNGIVLEAYLHLSVQTHFFVNAVNYEHSGISPPVNC